MEIEVRQVNCLSGSLNSRARKKETFRGQLRLELILYLSKYSYVHKNVIAASLAWISEVKNHSLEVYYEALRSGEAYGGPPAKNEDYFGSTVLGGHHHEQFFLINSLFNVKYAISGGSTVFSPFIELIGGKKTIVQTDSISEFYRRVFFHFNLKIPKAAVMVKSDSTYPSILKLDPFCYPEIYYRHAIGVTSEIKETELIKLREMGVQKLYLVYVPREKIELLKALGFTIEIVDKLTPSDTYKTVLTRLSQRWLDKAKGFMIGDPVLVSYWLPWCCRNNTLAVSEPSVVDTLREYNANMKNVSKIIFGRQSSEKDILHISKRDYCFQIVDPGRPLFPVMDKIKGSFYEPEESYFDQEPSDAELESYARDKKILSSVLFWCPDLRHVECLYRILDLVAVTNAKIGIGITAHWYKYNRHPLQIINVPFDSGGVYPNVEPLLCSCGLGVACEAEGFMSYGTLLSDLKRAKEIMLETTSEKFLPKGSYPFLDTRLTGLNLQTDPPFIKKVTKPSDEINSKFAETLIKTGFEYFVSLVNMGEPKIPFRKGDFLAINYTAGRWTGVSPYIVIDSVKDIKLAEKRITNSRKPGWILSTIDSPLWLFSKPAWRYSSKLWDIINYIKNSGASNKLVNTTPHTISRYARILDEKGLL
jgi:hypothetical protein